VFGRSLAAAVVGAAAFAAGLALDPRRALFSLLVAWTFALGVVIGVLVFVLSAHAMKAKWPVVVRRAAESVVATMPAFAALFIPLAAGAAHVWPWTTHAGREGLEGGNSAWLTPVGLVVRSAIWLACWTLVSEILRRWSLRQDGDADPVWTLRARRLAPAALIAVAVATTFASFDWMMSLTPEWFSSVFGVYWFAGGFLGAFALLVVLLHAGRVPGGFGESATSEHFVALGKFLLAFTVFWAYIAYAQLFVYWIANVPEEISWWVPRLRGAWGYAGIVMIVGEFAVPFFLLLSRDLKTQPRALAAVSVWTLAFHYLDSYWLVMPAFDPSAPRLHWLDAATLLLVVGTATALGAWRAAGVPAVARNDPFFTLSAEYRST